MAFSLSEHLKGQTFVHSAMSATFLPSSSAYGNLISQDVQCSSLIWTANIFFPGQNIWLVKKYVCNQFAQRTISKLFFTMNLLILPLR